MGALAAAAYIGVSLSAMHKTIDTGLVPAYRKGRFFRLRRSDLDDHVEAVRVKPGALSTSTRPTTG